MGNQGSAADGLRRGVEVVQDGLLGKVSEIHVWTNRPIWPQAPGVVKRPDGMDPVPDSLDWEAWIGPAPMRPFKTKVYHPFAWRGWWDFGTGALGDMACHTANMAFRACELTSPTTIEADATDVNDETYPSSAKIRYEYPKRGDKPHQAALTFWWYEGKRGGKNVLPAPSLVPGEGEHKDRVCVYFKDDKWFFFDPNEKNLKRQLRQVSSGSFMIGEKGVLFSPDDYGAEAYLVTQDGVKKVSDGKPEHLPSNNKADGGMKEEWVRAIKEGKPEIAYSNFGIAGMLTEAILLGNVAIRAGKKVEFDAAKLECKNSKEGNQVIKREYRKGWELTERA
jgi:hypothetical protein